MNRKAGRILVSPRRRASRCGRHSLSARRGPRPCCSVRICCWLSSARTTLTRRPRRCGSSPRQQRRGQAVTADVAHDDAQRTGRHLNIVEVIAAGGVGREDRPGDVITLDPRRMGGEESLLNDTRQPIGARARDRAASPATPAPYPARILRPPIALYRTGQTRREAQRPSRNSIHTAGPPRVAEPASTLR